MLTSFGVLRKGGNVPGHFFFQGNHRQSRPLNTAQACTGLLIHLLRRANSPRNWCR